MGVCPAHALTIVTGVFELAAFLEAGGFLACGSRVESGITRSAGGCGSSGGVLWRAVEHRWWSFELVLAV